MGEEAPSPSLAVQALDKGFATEHVDRLYELVKLIPGVHYEPEDVLATTKPDGRIMHAKWQHSYVIVDDQTPVGLVMGYERKAEANALYPSNSLYISELAVDPAYQHHGYARELLARQLKDTLNRGFAELDGAIRFSVQTNSAEWNEPVRELYKSFSFQITGHKQYPNRTDVVMQADVQGVTAAMTDGSIG